MHKFSIIFSSAFILISSTMAIESKAENEKYKFIKDIYSESWALIIGINDYQNVDPLSYAVDDAIAINNILTEKYGFKKEHIKLIINEEATKDNIMNGFQDILLSAGDKDRIVVFYAGHGDTYPLPNGGDMGYLIPVDGEATKERIFLTSISMSTLEELATMSAAKHILYLVDACYGGLTLSTRGLGKEQTPEYLKKMTKEKGRQVITAGGKDEQVMEKAEWGHSAFTKNLISGLKNELADANDDGIISAEELGIFIRDGVIIDTESQHTPQKGRIGSDMGEFVFISETLEEQVALADSDGDGLNEIKDQMAAQQKQMAQLTELLLAQAQNQQDPKTQKVEPVENYPKVTPKSKKPKKPKQPANMKTASTLSWVFPGMGHYYSSRAGRGFFFTAMELTTLASVAITSSSYFEKVDEYNAFENNVVAVGGGWTDSERKQYFDEKNNAIPPLIGSCVSAGIIWAWNVWDVKKTSSSKYSDIHPVSIGINSQGQLEARISF